MGLRLSSNIPSLPLLYHTITTIPTTKSLTCPSTANAVKAAEEEREKKGMKKRKMGRKEKALEEKGGQEEMCKSVNQHLILYITLNRITCQM
ncbi:hypothetical protein NQZ68_027195 [Dissostichus eleginoides]|nr:hypothetical protein NQZ68_027195 [Dissostichus eleginoides]